MNRGAKTVIAACTHGVLSGDAIARIDDSPISRMVITDSINHAGKKLTEKFDILPCSELIGEAIKRIFDEESVSSLFEDHPLVI
jgi:ribose-phosphate pyrophosphokinase